MNEKMRGINIQEKASMCGKCKMWLVMVVFALISTAMLSSVKIHAASAEENQMANVETNHVTAVDIRSARCLVMEKTGYMTSPSIPWKSIL